MNRLPHRCGCSAAALLLLAGCGTSQPGPSQATTYQCALGRSFVVTVRPGSDRVVLQAGRQRLLLPAEGEAGKDEAGKSKPGAAGRYVLGGVALQLQGDEVALEGAPGGPYEGCSAAGPAVETAVDAPPFKVE